jgi:hypothetical protein
MKLLACVPIYFHHRQQLFERRRWPFLEVYHTLIVLLQFSFGFEDHLITHRIGSKTTALIHALVTKVQRDTRPTNIYIQFQNCNQDKRVDTQH